jgi:hypothetical protein
MPDSCVAPRSGFRAYSIALRCITDLFKIGAHPVPAAQLRFFIGLRLLSALHKKDPMQSAARQRGTLT